MNVSYCMSARSWMCMLTFTCLSWSLQNYGSKSLRHYLNHIQAGPRWLLVCLVCDIQVPEEKFQFIFSSDQTFCWYVHAFELIWFFFNGYGQNELESCFTKWAVTVTVEIDFSRITWLLPHSLSLYLCFRCFLNLSLSVFLSAVQYKATLESCFTRSSHATSLTCTNMPWYGDLLQPWTLRAAISKDTAAAQR